MLGVLRNNAKSILVYVVFGLIIVVFILYFGWGDIRQGQERWLVKVNKRTVSAEEYRKYYAQLVNYYQRVHQADLNKDLVEKLGLKQQATDSLINELLLLETAEKANLIITEGSLRKAIEEIPGFQVNGKFDEQTYQELLRQNKLTPQEFENEQRKGLMVSQIRDFVINGVKCSEKELQDKFIWENGKAAIEFIEIDPEELPAGGEPTEGEIKALYDKHQEEFRVPEKIKISYIEFSPKDFEDQVAASPEEIAEYYKNFSEEFWEPKKVHARHILIKVDPDSKVEEKAEAKKKAEEILSQLKKGKPFELMALMYSQDQATAKDGGDLGFFPRGQMIKEFDNVAFSLKPGEISGVVETKFGFHIIKAEGIKEEGLRPPEEAEGAIRENLIKEKAQDLTKREVYRGYRTVLKTKDLKKYADQEGLMPVETNYFSREESTPILGGAGELVEEIFRFNPGEITPPSYINESYYIIQLIDKKKSYIPRPDEVKEKIVVMLKKEIQKQAAKRKGEELLKRLNQGSTLQEIAEKEKLAIKETGLFARTNFTIPKIGDSPEMMTAAFSLRPETPFAKEVFEVSGKVYLIKLKTKEEARPEDFFNKEGQLAKEYLYEKTNKYLHDWLKNAQARARIVFNPKFEP